MRITCLDVTWIKQMIEGWGAPWTMDRSVRRNFSTRWVHKVLHSQGDGDWRRWLSIPERLHTRHQQGCRKSGNGMGPHGLVQRGIGRTTLLRSWLPCGKRHHPSQHGIQTGSFWLVYSIALTNKHDDNEFWLDSKDSFRPRTPRRQVTLDWKIRHSLLNGSRTILNTSEATLAEWQSSGIKVAVLLPCIIWCHQCPLVIWIAWYSEEWNQYSSFAQDSSWTPFRRVDRWPLRGRLLIVQERLLSSWERNWGSRQLIRLYSWRNLRRYRPQISLRLD